jgi:hypothetical protein
MKVKTTGFSETPVFRIQQVKNRRNAGQKEKSKPFTN